MHTDAVSLARSSLLDVRLRQELAGSSADRLRSIAIAAAGLAVESIADRPPALDRALGDLRARRMDPSTGARVASLAEELDERYLDLQDEVRPGGRSPAWREAFRLARAASALAFAFSPDPETAASESIYEALHTLDQDADAILAVVKDTS